MPNAHRSAMSRACRRTLASHRLGGVVILMLGALLGPAQPADAQFGKALKDVFKKTKEAVQKTVEEAVDDVLDGTIPDLNPGPDSTPTDSESPVPGNPPFPVTMESPSGTHVFSAAEGDRIPVARLVGADEEFVAILADGTAERFSHGFGGSPVGPADDARHARVIDVAVTSFGYKLVLFEDGSLFCTKGWFGDDGHRPPRMEWIPESCQDPANPVTDVAGGGSNFAAVLADGSLVVWGNNDKGQCDVPSGIGTGDNPVASVAIGSGHIVAILRGGSIACWGDHSEGRCDVPSGIGTPENPVVEVAAGHSHAVALLKDGSMACWGSNAAGQCAIPLGVSGQRVATVAAGGMRTGAVLADGSVHLWGWSRDVPGVPDDLGAGGRRVASIALATNNDVAFLLSDGSVSKANAEFLSDLGRPKVGVRTVEGAVWSFSDGSHFPEQRWLEAVRSPTNPVEQVFWRIDDYRKEYAYAVLADGSVVSNDVVSNDPRTNVDWLRGYRVKRILGRDGRTGVWCHDGSVISNNFKGKKVRTIFSPAPSLRIKAAHAYDSQDDFVLFDNGTLGFVGSDPTTRSVGIVQVANKFPDGVGTGKFRVDSIVGTGWVTLADGRLVGSLSNPPLPPTPIGSTDNRVVSAVKTPNHSCMAALEDGSIVIWYQGKVLYQGKPKDSGESSVAVPRVVSLLETDYGRYHTLAILEDGSVTAIRHSPGDSTGACFRPCRPQVPLRCKVFGTKYALPSSY